MGYRIPVRAKLSGLAVRQSESSGPVVSGYPLGGIYPCHPVLQDNVLAQLPEIIIHYE